MNPMKFVQKVFIVIVVALAFSSCTSKEEKAVERMNELAETLQEVQNPNELDWEDLANEYAEIMNEANNCQFSKEERKEFFKQAGKVHAAMLKQSIKLLPGIMESVTDAAEGYMEGLSGVLDELEDLDFDNLDDDELEELENFDAEIED